MSEESARRACPWASLIRVMDHRAEMALGECHVRRAQLGRGFCQYFAFGLELASLATQPRQLFMLGRGQRVVTRPARGSQLQIVRAVGSNPFSNSAGARPAFTGTISARNSAG
ncbi:hypothetical protein [Paraburkholderia sp. BL17N1]|uniref:hypothetical protein n=1 Tax=Paraburkholderia sp. BL17N1 TaxID=1938798 RepID=UPI0011C34EB2|nr:hypothetical protein [Paraburkholderia sp. BL17N1]